MDFDEYKNQYGQGGFVTEDLKPCRAIARLIAIVYDGSNHFYHITIRHFSPHQQFPMLFEQLLRWQEFNRKRHLLSFPIYEIILCCSIGVVILNPILVS